tara:strand:- start:1160 stop:1387 length:228 start_codon:yes stop_codon:yes gene_type:complete
MIILRFLLSLEIKSIKIILSYYSNNLQKTHEPFYPQKSSCEFSHMFADRSPQKLFICNANLTKIKSFAVTCKKKM